MKKRKRRATLELVEEDLDWIIEAIKELSSYNKLPLSHPDIGAMCKIIGKCIAMKSWVNELKG